MDYKFNIIKNKLRLNTWDENNIFSPDMKDFYNLIIDKLTELESDLLFSKQTLLLVNDEVDIIKKYLNYKSLNTDLDTFKNFMYVTPNATDVEIKAFFRKKKIEKILDEQF
jgi:hypothetical protein